MQILLTAVVGLVAGVIDILPMIKMKIDKYAISSAFVFYFTMPFIVYYSTFLESLWWLRGGLIVFVLALPIIIAVAKQDKKGILPMSIMAIVLGTAIGIAEHFIGTM